MTELLRFASLAVTIWFGLVVIIEGVRGHAIGWGTFAMLAFGLAAFVYLMGWISP